MGHSAPSLQLSHLVLGTHGLLGEPPRSVCQKENLMRGVNNILKEERWLNEQLVGGGGDGTTKQNVGK